MILSNLKRNQVFEGKETLKEIPRILEIQEILCKVGTKLREKDIGSERWIEPPDASELLENHLKLECGQKRVEAKILVKEIGDYLLEHFRKWKTPVMIDDAIKAYILCGVHKSKEGTFVLLFDPHITSNVDKGDYERGFKKGVSWEKVERLFVGQKEWMLAFPTTQKKI